MHQKERSESTRRALIDATVQCLAELGYDGTSTVAVCRRAGLARGTMLHHFPNRQSLVLATLDDVLQRRVEEFLDDLSHAEPADFRSLVWHLWRAIRSGPTFAAWLELAVASRTDPVLSGELRAVMKRFDGLVSAASSTLLPPQVADGVDRAMAVSLVFSALNGLAIDLLQNDADVVEQRVAVLAELVSMFESPS